MVEDNAILIMEIEAMLRANGCGEVHTAGDLPSAMDLSRRHDYDLVVLDMNLGGTDGTPLATERIAGGLPILIVSGYDKPPALNTSGANVVVLAKPIDDAQLVDALKVLLPNGFNKVGSATNE